MDTSIKTKLYSKKGYDPRAFEYDPTEDESYHYIPTTLADISKGQVEQFNNLKQCLRDTSGTYFSNEILHKITRELLGYNDEWGRGIYNIRFFQNLSDLYDLRVGFNEIRTDLKKKSPNIYYIKKVRNLFIALEDYGFFPTHNYIDDNDKINQDDCDMLTKAFTEFKGHTDFLAKNKDLSSKSSNKANTLLFDQLIDIHNKLFNSYPNVTKSEYNDYSGTSKVFFESVFCVLNLKPIFSESAEIILDQKRRTVVPVMDSLINYLKDNKKKK